MTKLWILIFILLYVLVFCWAEMDCCDYLVSGPTGVPDAALSASSSYTSSTWHVSPACGRLYMNKEGTIGCPAPNIQSWCSKNEDEDPYIQVKFADLKKIVGVVLEHRLSTVGNRVRTYQVLYSENGEDWKHVKSEYNNQTFDFPVESTEIYVTLNPHVVAKYVRVRPLTWNKPPPTPPCLKFDVIGCNHDNRRRRFAYLPLPAGLMSDNDVVRKRPVNDLGECSLICHRDVTCRSFSYSKSYRQCILYSVNRYNQVKSKQRISDKEYLYYFDMTNIDLYMTIDPVTGLVYKVITRKYNKDDARTACEDFGMRLLVVNTEDKLDLLARMKSSSLILELRALQVSGGWYEVNGTTKWWDGGDPPQPVSDELVKWNTAVSSGYGDCLFYNNNQLQQGDCTAKLFSVCET